MLQLGLEPHPFGDIPAVEDQPALVAVDGGLDVEPAAVPGADPALDTGRGLLVGPGGQEAADLVQHPAQVLGVDVGGEFGADHLLGVPPVDPLGGRADVPQHAGGGGDHDDVAGTLHQGAEVVLLLGEFLGQRDVVEQHDALAHHQDERHRAAGEEHDAVDLPAAQHVVDDAQGADRGGQIGGEGAERSGGPALRTAPAHRGARPLAVSDPRRVGQQHAPGEPAGVEDLPGAVVLTQQGRGEQGVAQHRQGEGGDRGVDGGAVGGRAPEVQREDHRHQHDVQHRVGQRQGDAGGAAAVPVRRLGQRQAPGEGQQGAADQPGVQCQADPARPGDRAFGEHQQPGDGRRREQQEAEVGRRGVRHGPAQHHLVPPPDAVTGRDHRGREPEQRPGRAVPAGHGTRVPQARQAGGQRGGGEPEVAHELREGGRAPVQGGTGGVPAAQQCDRELGQEPGPPGGFGGGGQHRP